MNKNQGLFPSWKVGACRLADMMSAQGDVCVCANECANAHNFSFLLPNRGLPYCPWPPICPKPNQSRESGASVS